jgi:hypothetical protein
MVRMKVHSSKRLRAIVQNLNLAFAELMRARGHWRKIIDDKKPVDRKSSKAPIDSDSEPGTISRIAFVKEVVGLLQRNRGRELPGIFSPMIVADLFPEQPNPWSRLAKDHLEPVWNATRKFMELAVSHLTDAITANALLQEFIDPLMTSRIQLMRAKLDELLHPYPKSIQLHTITTSVRQFRR